MDFNVAHVDGGEVRLQLRPVLAAVLGVEQPELCPDEQQVGVDVIFRDGVRGAPVRQIAGDASPCAPAIVRAVDVRLMVAAFVIVEHGVGDVWFVN